MKRFLSLAIILAITLLNFQNSFADVKTLLFEGFNSKIVSIIDEMTDKKRGVIKIDRIGEYNLVTLSIYGPDDFAIWPNDRGLHFAFDEKHLIRVGKSKPIELVKLRKLNALVPKTKAHAREVIQGLARGKKVLLRFYEWPGHGKADVKLTNPHFGYVYKKAANYFKWPHIKGTAKLPAPKLKILKSHKGDKIIAVSIDYGSNHSDLSLDRGMVVNTWQIALDTTTPLFGVQTQYWYYSKKFGKRLWTTTRTDKTTSVKKRWFLNEEHFGKSIRVIVRNKQDDILFDSKQTVDFMKKRLSPAWRKGKQAAVAAWHAAPEGSIEVIQDNYGREERSKTVLYGFRELWEWGVNNEGLPPMEMP
jgi:hypothetical protein